MLKTNIHIVLKGVRQALKAWRQTMVFAVLLNVLFCLEFPNTVQESVTEFDTRFFAPPISLFSLFQIAFGIFTADDWERLRYVLGTVVGLICSIIIFEIFGKSIFTVNGFLNVWICLGAVSLILKLVQDILNREDLK